jgi:DNA polymerase I
MIYLVTTQLELFNNDAYKIITPKESLDIMKDWKVVQYDSETSGRDAHINKILCVQFGNDAADIRIVVDTSTVNLNLYKDILESKLLIGQNLKFDLAFLFNYHIIPRKIYDTMIVEQVLYLGYPSGSISYSLKAIAERRLGINIDKTVRGEIIWRGLDTSVILYAAGDVTYLERIVASQLVDLRKQGLLKAAKLECDFVPVITYLEWCGIKLDEKRWKAKMEKDQKCLEEAVRNLNAFVIKTPVLKQFTYVDRQGDLFSGFDLTPKVTINWASSRQVVEVAKLLGFNTTIQDKKTGKDKDSVLEKSLAIQKGINDEFLKLYLGHGNPGDKDYYAGYTGSAKIVSSFGQGHLDAINPITKRLYTSYKQLGAASGRMSCGSQQPNTDLAKLKHLPTSSCKYLNIQQLPNDAETRACFIAEQNNKLIDCDWSAAEARLAGDIYNDQAVKDIFLNNIDSHSMYAKIFFKEELKDIDVHDIKKLRPDLRQKSKGPEFALNFGGGVFAIKQALQCSDKKAEEIIRNYEEGFKGSAIFAKKGSQFVRSHGYVLMNPITGHKMYWWDWKQWKEEQNSYNSAFWEEYKMYHKGSGDSVEQDVKHHFKAASKWDRMARNAPTQGTCCIMLKHSQLQLFNYIVDNNLFGKCKLCALVHDECLWEVPNDMAEKFARLIEKEMLSAAGVYCKSLPIPAEAEISDHWIH